MKSRTLFLLLALNIALVLIESSFLSVIFDKQLVFCLVFSFAVALFVAERAEHAFVSALLGGLVIDLLGVGIIGITPIILIGVLVVFTYVRRLFLKNLIVNVLFIYIANILYITLTFEPRFSFYSSFILAGILNVCVTGLFVVIIHKFSIARHGYRL